LRTRIFSDAIVERFNFTVENFKRSLTREALLARRRIFAIRHRLDEMFDVDAANVAACRVIEPALRMMCPAIERRYSYRRIRALRLSDCNGRG
jgi:hypothetical protein